MSSQVPAVIVYTRHVTRAESASRENPAPVLSLKYVQLDFMVSHKCFPPLRWTLSLQGWVNRLQGDPWTELTYSSKPERPLWAA